jgi:hypothetical protein
VLGAESINKTITRLGQILAVAEERDLIARNPVRINTKNRKLKTRKAPVYLDTAESIQALLDAATEIDNRNVARTSGRRALIALIGHHWALASRLVAPTRQSGPRSQTTKAPRMQGLRTMGAAGFEPATSRV